MYHRQWGQYMRNKVRFLTETGKKRLYRKYGIIFDKTTRDVLRVHNKNESWGHFLTKAVLYKLFRDKGYHVLLEAQTENGIIDVFVLELGLAIEVLSNSYPKKVKNVKNHYTAKEVVVIQVPSVSLDDFLMHIKDQIKIWL